MFPLFFSSYNRRRPVVRRLWRWSIARTAGAYPTCRRATTTAWTSWRAASRTSQTSTTSGTTTSVSTTQIRRVLLTDLFSWVHNILRIVLCSALVARWHRSQWLACVSQKEKSNQIIALSTKWDTILRFCFGTAKGSGGGKQIRLSEGKLLQTNDKFLLVACRGGNDPRLWGSKIEGWPGRGWNHRGRDVLLCSVCRHEGIMFAFTVPVKFTFTVNSRNLTLHKFQGMDAKTFNLSRQVNGREPLYQVQRVSHVFHRQSISCWETPLNRIRLSFQLDLFRVEMNARSPR